MKPSKIIEVFPLLDSFVRTMKKADVTGDDSWRGLASGYRKRALRSVTEKEFAKLVGAYMRLTFEGKNVTAGSLLRAYRGNEEIRSNVAEIERAVASLFGNLPYVKEFTGGKYSGRVDMLVIGDDDTLTAVEIKSDRDNLNRMARQLLESKLTFDYTYAAIDVKHYEKFAKNDFGSGVGLIVYDGNSAEIVTEPVRNENACYFDFLWKKELARMASPYTRKAHAKRMGELIEIVRRNVPCAKTCDDARSLLVRRLRARAAK